MLVHGTHDEVIDIESLKKANLVPSHTMKVKVIKSGEIKKAVKIRGLAVTKGAREAIEAAGGTVNECTAFGLLVGIRPIIVAGVSRRHAQLEPLLRRH